MKSNTTSKPDVSTTYLHVCEPVKVEYDHEAKAAYVKVGKGKYHHGFEFDDTCRIDFDEYGNIIGIELLGIECDHNSDCVTTTG